MMKKLTALVLTLALCLTAAFAVDTTWSVQKALDTKHLLASLSETSRRLAVVQEKLRDAAKELELDLESKLPDPKQALQRAAADGESKKAYLLHKLQERRDSTNGLLDRLNEKNRAALAQVSARSYNLMVMSFRSLPVVILSDGSYYTGFTGRAQERNGPPRVPAVR